jgi:hypothetical protein
VAEKIPFRTCGVALAQVYILRRRGKIIMMSVCIEANTAMKDSIESLATQMKATSSYSFKCS